MSQTPEIIVTAVLMGNGTVYIDKRVREQLKLKKGDLVTATIRKTLSE